MPDLLEHELQPLPAQTCISLLRKKSYFWGNVSNLRSHSRRVHGLQHAEHGSGLAWWRRSGGVWHQRRIRQHWQTLLERGLFFKNNLTCRKDATTAVSLSLANIKMSSTEFLSVLRSWRCQINYTRFWLWSHFLTSVCCTFSLKFSAVFAYRLEWRRKSTCAFSQHWKL